MKQLALIIFSVIILQEEAFCQTQNSYLNIKDDRGSPMFSIGSSLSYLSKAAVAKALKGRNYDDLLDQCQFEDSSNCAKRLLCELQTEEDQELEWDELLIKELVPVPLNLSDIVCPLQLAVTIGQNQGVEQCAKVYRR